VLQLLAFPVVFLVAWQALAVVLDHPSVPTVDEAYGELVLQLSRERFRLSVLDTIYALTSGFFISLAIGLVLGSLLGRSRYWTSALGPIIYGINATPKIVFYPIFLTVLGVTMGARIGYATLSGVLVVTLVMMEASANLDAKYQRIAQAYDLSRLQFIRFIIVPALLPSFATAARLAFAMIFLALTVAELFSSPTGIGHEIVRHMQLAAVDRIVAVVMLVFLIAIGPVSLLRAIEVRINRRFELV
jgi:ABC-type nitrate/sulfonate/bicarbonate transport system permease component